MTEPVEAAKLAGLTYVTAGRPGITRRRAGKSFTYLDPDGARVRDAETLTERAIVEEIGGLTPDEAVVLGMLQQRLAHAGDNARAA